MYRLGEVDFVDMDVLSRLFDDYRVRYAGTEVVHEEPGEDFLLDRLLLPRMEICHPDGIFQPSEGCFDSPNAEFLLIPSQKQNPFQHKEFIQKGSALNYRHSSSILSE